MKVLVLGGTGGIGIEFITECLLLDYTVVAYARSPEKLPEHLANDARVSVIQGSLTDGDALLRALEGVDAVISALGPAVNKGPFHPAGTPIAKGYGVLLEQMRKASVTRLIALGTASNTDDNDRFSLEFWTLVNGVAVFARNAYKDVVALGELIRADQEIAWTLARVPMLTSSDEREYYAGYIGDGKTRTWLSRKAYAAFVVQELTKNEWLRKAPMVSLP